SVDNQTYDDRYVKMDTRSRVNRFSINNVHSQSQENARVACVATLDSTGVCRRKNRGVAWGGFNQRERRSRNSERSKGCGQANDRTDTLDVLERAPRWPRAHA